MFTWRFVAVSFVQVTHKPEERDHDRQEIYHATTSRKDSWRWQ